MRLNLSLFLLVVVACDLISSSLQTIVDNQYNDDILSRGSIGQRQTRLRVRRRLGITTTKSYSKGGMITQYLSKFLSSPQSHHDARIVSNFLESHLAHSVHDPRAYFTEERTSRSLAIMLNNLAKVPYDLRFAYVVRLFNELGRKIATKLNYYSSEVVGILKKTPDQLGNRPGVNMLVDAISQAFDSKEDHEIREDNSEQSPMGSGNQITDLLSNNSDKAKLFNSSLIIVAQQFATIMSHFTFEANRTCLKIPVKHRQAIGKILSDSLQLGTWTMVNELSKSDKFKVTDEVILFTDEILKHSIAIFHKRLKKLEFNSTDKRTLEQFQENKGKFFKDLNFVSDKTGLIGPWNNYLFSNLGTSERVIKLFASLLIRVPVTSKSRWINMYIAQVNLELERTMPAFVAAQAVPVNTGDSFESLIDNFNNQTRLKSTSEQPEPINSDYANEKHKIPARCYLAGRRWRMILIKSIDNYGGREELFKGILSKLSQLKFKLTSESGGEIYRLCLPRLEAGLKGFSITGEPDANRIAGTGKFSLKNSIKGLDTMKDPFTEGVNLGYKLAFKVGYNEDRKATLEMENSGQSMAQDAKSKTMLDDPEHNHKAKVSKNKEQIRREISETSFRKAATAASRRAFEVAIHEGYMTALKVSLRAGLRITTATASKLADLKGASYGKLIGRETGRSVAEIYLQRERLLNETDRRHLIETGEMSGEQAGLVAGQTIGSIVGAAAAEEAFKRSLTRGGQLERARFHIEEFEAGAKLGFELGLKEGQRVGSSASLDPSAPNFMRFNQVVDLFGGVNPNREVDPWEKELIPELTAKTLMELHEKRGHILISGSMTGLYREPQEVKKGFERVSFKEETHLVRLFASGYSINDVAYLTLNGTVDSLGILRGSLISKDIFDDNEFDDDGELS